MEDAGGIAYYAGTWRHKKNIVKLAGLHLIKDGLL